MFLSSGIAAHGDVFRQFHSLEFRSIQSPASHKIEWHGNFPPKPTDRSPGSSVPPKPAQPYAEAPFRTPFPRSPAAGKEKQSLLLRQKYAHGPFQSWWSQSASLPLPKRGCGRTSPAHRPTAPPGCCPGKLGE